MVVQPSFDVPSEIALGLASGDLVTGGWVIRNTKGQIVKHLSETDIRYGVNEGALKEAVTGASAFVGRHRRGVIVGLVVAGVAFVAMLVVGILTKRKRDAEAEERRKAMEGFQAALRAYVDALEAGTLTKEVIQDLDVAMQELDGSPEVDGGMVQVTGKEFSRLVRAVRRYTSELSEANGYEDPYGGLQLVASRKSDYETLGDCLVTQWGILDEVA